MKIALIPCGSTEWQDEGRLLGRVEIPLTSAGRERCIQWAQQLHGVGIKRILHGPDELVTQTAALVAGQLDVPTKTLDDLAEVDIGLWTGLTESQLKRRFASAHRELGEAPLNVSPPGGEALRAAADRLIACMRKQLRKNGKEPVGVVMRPFSLALAKAVLEGHALSDLWETTHNASDPVVIEWDLKSGT